MEKSDLESRRVIKLTAAAKVLSISPRRLRAVMEAKGTPIVDLGEHSRGVMLRDLDELLRTCTRPAA